MNDQNLKGHEFERGRSSEEAAIAGRKGGLASGVARRERKLISQLLREVLDEVISDNGTTRGAYIVKAALNDVATTGELNRLKAVEMIQRVLGENIIKIEQTAPTLNIITTPDGADALKRLTDAVNEDGDKDN